MAKVDQETLLGQASPTDSQTWVDDTLSPSSDEREGVIRFTAHHTTRPLTQSEQTPIPQLNYWRRQLKQAGMVGGGDPSRYHGLGFGNLSAKLKQNNSEALALGNDEFLITSSQTGHFNTLNVAHYTLVTACHPPQNSVVSFGESLPSSETLTHGMVYLLYPSISWVFHVHAPLVWRLRKDLKLLSTPTQVKYGTPEMADMLRSLDHSGHLHHERILAMDGHEDGLLCFGETASEVGKRLLSLQQRAQHIKKDKC